jgi:hypothetical protein
MFADIMGPGTAATTTSTVVHHESANRSHTPHYPGYAFRLDERACHVLELDELYALAVPLQVCACII